MLIRYNKKLETSWLQFSFKAGNSTVRSSLAMKEVINYYQNRHSKVYVTLIDASKAFDRIRYDRLFDPLYTSTTHYTENHYGHAGEAGK